MKRAAHILLSATVLGLVIHLLAGSPTVSDPKQATKETPWENSLGMRFVPVKGTDVLFCIWLTRVQDFEAFVKATGHDAKSGMFSLHADGVKSGVDSWESPGFEQTPTNPVCGVSWEDARAFCEWLTKIERIVGRLPATWEYRLPTDAEWSVAVGLPEEKGRTPKDKDGKIRDVYPWGTNWPPSTIVGNYAGVESKVDLPPDRPTIPNYNDGFPRTSPVGSFPPNAFGLYDMGGNLWQWCQDLYAPGELERVLRGGAWSTYDREELFSSRRNNVLPNVRAVGNGFRCVLAPVSTGSPPR